MDTLLEIFDSLGMLDGVVLPPVFTEKPPPVKARAKEKK